MADENNIGAALSNVARNPLPRLDTMPERRAREKRANMRVGSDGRSNRAAQPYRELNVKLPPEAKDRLNALCRRKGWLIRDFVLECLEKGFKEHE